MTKIKYFNILYAFCLTFLLKCKAENTINDRLDCVIENIKFTENQCRERDCIWSPVEGKPEIPYCYFDKTKIGYNIKENSFKSFDSGIEAELQLKESAKKTKFVEQLETLKLEIIYLTDNIVRIKILDPKNQRYEVPAQKNFPLLLDPPKKTEEKDRKYVVNLDKTNFQLNIQRKDSSAKIFDTSIGGLIFSDQFIQIATYLPSNNVYGLGENTHQSFRHKLNYKTWPIFTKDNPPDDHEKNNYGHHPFYTVLEGNGKSHGVLLLNSNAMEYTLMPSPAISFKTIGGILDFFVFVGDNPEHVVQLYTSLIGRTFMPAFWALGFQISKYGYHNTSHVKSVVDRQVKQQIPYDVQYIDSDYKVAQSQDFTIDPQHFGDLPKLIADTQRDLNLHWTPIVDPAVQGNDANYNIFTDGYHQNVFVKWPKSTPMAERQNPSGVHTDTDIIYGTVWPKVAAFPDFFKNVTQNWWVKNLDHLYKLGWRFNGVWIDMNEPANFKPDNHCPKSRFDNIPIKIKPLWVNGNLQQLSFNTLCMTGVQGDKDEYKHYDVHSLYGWSMAIPSQRALHEITGKRGFVLSRSTFVSSGRYTGHWLGDNRSLWPHIKHSVIGMLEFNLFGIPYIGADICGFFGKPTPQLCRRWQQLGAFYPFSRNHHENGVESEQDPAVWAEKLGHPEVTEAARNALYLRYSLLPYLYTLFAKSHMRGDTVVRPLFHEYPLDNNTYDIDQQFMWGSSILFSPFLFENQTEVDAYLPNDVWYEPNGDFVKLYPKTGHVKLPDSQLHPPIHFRGGSILPIAFNKAVNTKILQQKPIQLEVYPKNKTASGELFWDDGESVNSIVNKKYNSYKFQLLPNCKIEIETVLKGYNSVSPHIIDKILVANTIEGEIKATIDDNFNIVSPVSKADHTILPVNIDLNDKKEGQKTVISWKLSKDNSCNLK